MIASRFSGFGLGCLGARGWVAAARGWEVVGRVGAAWEGAGCDALPFPLSLDWDEEGTGSGGGTVLRAAGGALAGLEGPGTGAAGV